MLNFRYFILFLILSTSLGFAQSPYEGEWLATVADSLYTIDVEVDGDDFYANFRKKVISTNTPIYTSEIGPDFFALNASGVTSSLEKVSGMFDDIRFTGSTVQTLKFTFELLRDCRGCPLKATLHLEEMQGVRSPDYEPVRFPNDLTFEKQ